MSERDENDLREMGKGWAEIADKLDFIFAVLCAYDDAQKGLVVRAWKERFPLKDRP